MSDCSTRAWRVPEKREPGVLYDHGQPNYDYLQAHAIVVGGIRFDRVRECEMAYQTEGMQKGWWQCSECGEAMDTIESCAGRKPPRFCGNCGAKVVSA